MHFDFPLTEMRMRNDTSLNYEFDFGSIERANRNWSGLIVSLRMG